MKKKKKKKESECQQDKKKTNVGTNKIYVENDKCDKSTF